MSKQSSDVIVPGGDPLSSAELDLLNETLFKYETDASLENVSSLHGFLTAIVSGPNALPPGLWLHEIWGGEEYQPNWENMEEVQGFMTTTFKLMNNIAKELLESPETFEAIFMGDEDMSITSDWSNGYMNGVDLDLEAWGNMPDHLVERLDFLDADALMLPVDEEMQIQTANATAR
ncbi:MAG: UPF0149 family protein [Thiolinea sp.]